MSKRECSLFEFALLGMLRTGQPCSGYDLRKIFAVTPMRLFSDSPGAIYPALRRLEESGLIRGRIEETGAVRRRKMYRLSSRGLAVFKGWLRKPVEREDVVRRTAEMTMRFAYMEDVLGRDGCITFLESWVSELEAYIPTLHERLKPAAAKGSLSGRLALEWGIRGYDGLLAWARMALETFRKH